MSTDKADSLDDVIATVDELIAWYCAAIPSADVPTNGVAAIKTEGKNDS